MKTDIVERLRDKLRVWPYLEAAAADEIESLRQRVAELTNQRDIYKESAENWRDNLKHCQKQLAASQAKEQHLKSGIDQCIDGICDDWNTPDITAENALTIVLNHLMRIKSKYISRDTSALDAITKDAERLNFISSEYIKIDPFSIPTGGDDADVGWCLSQYYMAKPNEREIHRHYNDDLRSAIDAAIKVGAGGTAADQPQDVDCNCEGFCTGVHK
jgi:hypothetical protein